MKDMKLVYINIFYIQNLLLFGYILLCLITVSKSNFVNGMFPYLKKLNNNRYILISDNGITFLDQTLTNPSNSIEFENKVYSCAIVSRQPDYALSTKVVQFSNEYNNLILAMVFDKLYIFDSNETLLNNITTFPDFIIGIPYYFFPYKYINNNYIIYVLTVNSNEQGCDLNIQNITYNNETNIISISDKITNHLSDEVIQADDEPNNSIACELIKLTEKYTIYCIFGVFDSFEIVSIDIDNNFKLKSLNTTNEHMTNLRRFFRSISFPEKQEIIFCTYIYYYMECIKYNIQFNNYTKFLSLNHSFSYNYEQHFNVEYFEEADQFIIDIFGLVFDENWESSEEILVINCDMDLNCTKTNFTSVDGMSATNLYDKSKLINTVIPFGKLSYHLFVYNENNDISKYLLDLGINFDLKCKNYYNYAKTSCLNFIPEGFYCNNSNIKTIDKCHKNCKTCNKGPTENNNNCLTCNENAIYYDLGNCRDNCSNGYFLDENNTLTCQCTNNITCFFCNEDNQCKSCNTNKGYYPKSNEESNSDFINCYKDPVGYYFDNNTNTYNPCYPTCNKCSSFGNITDNKCLECIEGYRFISDYEDDTNCYKICDYYYYFDENKNYFCTPNLNCPDEYSKLIPDKKKCVKNTESDIITNSDTIISYISNDVTKDITSDIINDKNISECPIDHYLKNECNMTKPLEEIISLTRDAIKNNLIDELLIDIMNNKEVLTQITDNVTIQLISLDNQKMNEKENISIIDLGECEDILKSVYGINSSLIVYKMDIPIPGYSAKKVNYEIYNPNNFSVIDINYCNQSTINIKLPAYINSKEIFRYDPSSEYFNDMCFPFTNENDADIIILDRKNEFVDNNMSLCDNDCEFNGYDSSIHKVICKCDARNFIEQLSDIDIDSEKFFNGWVNIRNMINLKVLKCYKLLSTKDGFLKNVGNFIILTIILLFIVAGIYFYFKGFFKLKTKIIKLQEELLLEFKEDNQDIDHESQKKILVFTTDCKNKQKRKSKSKGKRKRKFKNKKKSVKKSVVSNSEMITQKIGNNNITNTRNRRTINQITSKISNDCEIGNKSEQKLNTNPEKDIRNIGKKNLTDYEMNKLKYKDAIELDKRTYLQYYWSLLKTKQLLIFTFYFNKDYNSYIIKITLFLFAFALYLTVSALFFNDDTIHRIYQDQGLFNFVYNIPQIFYSSIISALINIIVKSLSLSEKEIVAIKKESNPISLNIKIIKVIHCLKLKFILFFIISNAFLFLFWFYISCFCAVYRNTQFHLMKDTLLSFFVSLLYPFIINLIPIFMRIPAIKAKNKELLYKISKIVQLI